MAQNPCTRHCHVKIVLVPYERSIVLIHIHTVNILFCLFHSKWKEIKILTQLSALGIKILTLLNFDVFIIRFLLKKKVDLK